jgi:heme b synthase
MNPVIPKLRLVAWELTRACVLQCRHCRASASKVDSSNELTTEECLKILDSLATKGACIVILTGGEPLIRKDIFEIARYGTDKGLRMVLATCGTLLNEDMCLALIKAGVVRISVSIDGCTANRHDSFRGVSGAFEQLVYGIRAARRAGLEFQINTTVTKGNIDELQDIYNLALSLGAASFHPFLLVPVGRGREISNEIISAEEYEKTLNWMYDLHLKSVIPIKPTCAPHYYRILRERERMSGRGVTSETHGLDALTKGCLGGQGFAFISNTGEIQICGFLEKSAGNLRKNSFKFFDIWNNSDLLREIRDVSSYSGKCGYCEYNSVCGGCRARAFTLNNNYLGEEPQCSYVPQARPDNIR